MAVMKQFDRANYPRGHLKKMRLLVFALLLSWLSPCVIAQQSTAKSTQSVAEKSVLFGSCLMSISVGACIVASTTAACDEAVDAATKICMRANEDIAPLVEKAMKLTEGEQSENSDVNRVRSTLVGTRRHLQKLQEPSR